MMMRKSIDDEKINLSNDLLFSNGNHDLMNHRRMLVEDVDFSMILILMNAEDLVIDHDSYLMGGTRLRQRS